MTLGPIFTLTFLMLFCFSPGCRNIAIRNAITPYGRYVEGTYIRASEQCSGRPVYKLEDGPRRFYLSFIDKVQSTDFQGWVLSPYRCRISRIIYIVNSDPSLTPEVALGVWKETNGTRFNGIDQMIENPDLSVTCDTG